MFNGNLQSKSLAAVIVKNSLQFAFVLVSGDSLDNLATFEYQNCWNSGNSKLDRQLHVFAYVYLADDRFSIVLCCKFINDWTQSFARWSAFGPKINQNWFVCTEHLGFKCVFGKFCRHDLSYIKTDAARLSGDRDR